MPVLKITAEMIGPKRTRLALAYLEAVMLWPNDPDRRDEAVRTAAAILSRDYYVAVDALPLRKIQPESLQPFVYGLMTGELLSAAVIGHANGEPIKLVALKVEMITRNKENAHPALNFSLSTLENKIWRRYKPVSHLWASYFHTAHFYGDRTFPCRLDRLSDFLAMAEFYAREGLNLSPARRNEPLLTAEQLWTLPVELNGLLGCAIAWGENPCFDSSNPR